MAVQDFHRTRLYYPHVAPEHSQIFFLETLICYYRVPDIQMIVWPDHTTEEHSVNTQEWRAITASS